MYKKGDLVKVWSLQSFHHGGFIKGKDAIVSQDQTDINGSVLISVARNFDGETKIDPFYEVYPEQLKLVTKSNLSLLDKFNELLQEIRNIQ